MRSSDLPRINEFKKELQGKYYKPVTLKGLENILRLYVNGILVGIASIYIVETLTRKALIFEDFIISKKDRKQGLGTFLMKEIIKIAKIHKVDCIEGCTKKTNKIAQKLYKQFGFKDRKNNVYRKWLR